MKQYYCTKCGEHLIRVPYPAEKLFTYHPYAGKMPIGSKYNPVTGLRQFGIIAKCPNKKWYNNHTEYVDENSVHDADLPELLKLFP